MFGVTDSVLREPSIERAETLDAGGRLCCIPGTHSVPASCSVGAIPGGLSIGPPGKSSIDDSYGRYDLIQNSESPASPPVAVPHSWSRAKSDSDKISNGSSISWPPGKTA
jgi:hypothetical protein